LKSRQISALEIVELAIRLIRNRRLSVLKFLRRRSGPPLTLHWPSTNEAGWVACHDSGRSDLASNDCTSSNDRSFTDTDTWADKCISTNPGVRPDNNGGLQQIKCRTKIIVGSGAKVRELRNRRPRSNLNRAETVNYSVRANSRKISDTKVPRDRNFYAWIDVNVPPYMRAK
jgi:hypothetical protein